MKLKSSRLLGLLSASALIGLGSTVAAQVTTLELTHAWPGQRAFYEDVVNAFHEKHPDIRIEFRNSPASYDEGHQALLRGILTNQLPDIYMSGFHLLPELVNALERRDRAVDLGPFIANEPDEWLSDNYEPSILRLGQVDGKQYGLAFNASTPILFYNADLMRKAGLDPDNFPDNWKDLINTAKTIADKNPGVDGMAYDAHAWPDDWLWRALIMQQGGKVTAPEGDKVVFDGEVGLKALTLARQFVTDGAMVLRDFDQSRQQFAAGKVGLIFSSPNGARAFSDLIGDNFELRSATYPIENRENGTVPTGGNAVLILTDDPKRQAAAWEYIKFATSPEGQKLAVLGSGYMPTNKRALEPEYLGEFYDQNPNWYTSLEQIQYAEPWGGYKGQTGVEIWRTQRNLIDSVMRGDLPVEDGLERIVNESNALLAEAN